MTAGPRTLGSLAEATLESLATPSGRRWLARGIWAFGVLGVLVAVIVGADRPGNPRLLDPRAVALQPRVHSRPSRVPGFNQVGFRIIQERAGGTGRAGCALLADTAPRQLQGLMGHRDLAGYDAMIFRFPIDTTVAFYNKGVPIPLSLAWFDGSGVYLGQHDLAVCADACPTVAAPAQFRYAMEVAKGGLHRAGAAPGSVLLVGGACA